MTERTGLHDSRSSSMIYDDFYFTEMMKAITAPLMQEG